MEEFSRYTFHVKQDGNGNAFISLVPTDKGLTVLNEGTVAFTLPEGTPWDEASQLADYLDEKINQIAYVSLDHEVE